MPGFGDSFHTPVLSNPSNLDSSILPIHVARSHQNIEHQRRFSESVSGIPLDTLPNQKDSQHLHPEGFELSSTEDKEVEHSSDSSEEEGDENRHLVAGSSSSTSPMKRSAGKRSSKSRSPRPDLRIKTAQNGNLNGNANGHANGNGKMDSHIEMRRKNVSGQESAHSQVIARHDFTLDREPPLPTPQTPAMASISYSNLPAQDKRNFLLLVLLYFLQGIPMGLASGSVPFLLKKYLSYSQIGVFSLAIYPYSLKLLWSPIVDAVWSPRLGRRKSWILPIQTFSGISLIYLGSQIDDMMVAAGKDDGAGVWNFTGWWFFLVFLCATQDIAVDGWAISLLSIQNMSYASTAQTVGLTAGSFLSHTVFLALNAKDFANAWFRSTPKEVGLVTLGGYMNFFGWVYLIVTVGLAVLKKEDKTKERDGIIEVYRSMWGVLKLKNIITIIIIHLIAKIGFVTNDAVTSLKLLDKGFGQANMALVVLIDFPFEIGLGYYAGKWSTVYTPLRLWCWAFVARLAAALFAQGVIMLYPVPRDSAVPLWYLLTVITQHVYSTFMNTIMFVAVSAFHARIADPVIGGTYMTLLATVSNLGGTFPKIFVLKLVDLFTIATCIPPTEGSSVKAGHTAITAPFSCISESERHRCIDGGGICNIERDGYYITNVVFVVIGAILFWTYIQRKALALQALPLRAWRLGSDHNGGGGDGYTRVPT